MRVSNRFQAFAIHLAVSLLIALICGALVFLVWYPSPLHLATGVTAIFLILLGVDVVIGPVITLAIYNVKKKELRRDLAVVFVLQLCALAYGLHTVFVARPVYLVYAVDRFDLVYANDLSDEKLSKVTDARYKSLPWTRPQIVAAKRPDDAALRSDIMMSAALGGDDVPQLPQLYVPFESERALVKSRMKPLDALKDFNRDRGADVDRVIQKYRDVPGGVGFVPVRGKVQDLTAILGREAGDLLEVVDLSPWN